MKPGLTAALLLLGEARTETPMPSAAAHITSHSCLGSRKEGGGGFFFSRTVEAQACTSDSGGGSFGSGGRIHFSACRISEGRPNPVGQSLIPAISAWAAAVELEARVGSGGGLEAMRGVVAQNPHG